MMIYLFQSSSCIELTEIQSLKTGFIQSLDMTDDSKMIVAGSSDSNAEIYSFKNGSYSLHQKLTDSNGSERVEITGDGGWLLTIDR